MRKLSILALAIMLILTGCFGENNAEENKIKEKNDSEVVAVSNKEQHYNGGSTVLDLKKKYGTDQEKALMPFYNVEHDKKFTFHFKSDIRRLSYRDVISVHSDIKAQEESRIDARMDPFDYGEGPTTIILEPESGALNTDRDGGDTWGRAPIYYIKVSYDFDTDIPTKLEKPMIIPFTIKSEVNVPTVKPIISADGRLKLVWNKIEGADKYRVYQITVPGSFDNIPLNAVESGFRMLHPRLKGELTGTEFDDWMQDGLGGLSALSQNRGLFGDYFVTALVGDKESIASNLISSNTLGDQLPSEANESIFAVYDSISSVPSTVSIKMINETIKNFNLIYHTDGMEPADYLPTRIPYSVQGTTLNGEIAVKNITKDELIALSDSNPENTSSALVKPDNQTDYIPTPDVPTIIEASPRSSNDGQPLPDSIVDEQLENTKNVVNEAHEEIVPPAPPEIPVNVDSALEEYLALHMLAGSDEIALGAFPEAQNFETITDILLEVMYQNPLIIGVNSWRYDYRTLTLGISYNDTTEEIQKQQEEIAAEAQKIVSSIIKEAMSDDEKREAIYRYLADNTSYDHSALKAAEENNFQGDIGEQFDDSFTTYGIMVKKVGVCMSYAYSYKLLADLAGIESIVVTGSANGVPHAWNKVKIGDDWLHVDVTNNDNESSLGFRLLYNSNDDSAVGVNSILTNDFWADAEIPQFYGKSETNDFYVVNGLQASTIDEYKAILSSRLKTSDSVIAIRYNGKYDEESFYQVIGTALQDNRPDKLDKAGFTPLGNFVVVFTE